MRWLERLALAGWLTFAAAGVWAVPSQPPLVPEGEVFDEVEALLAAVSRRSPVNSIAFSPDGKTLAAGSDDGTVRLWDVAVGDELSRFEGHSSGVRAVAFSPDGKTLASQ